MSRAAGCKDEEPRELTLPETLKEGELLKLISLKGLLAQYEMGEIVDDEDDPAPPQGSPGNRVRLTDMAVVRFLRGRKLDEQKAFRALIRHLKWRATNEVASITSEMVFAESRQRKIVNHGRDRDQRPCIYIFAHRHKTSDRDINVMQKFIIKTLEDTMKHTKPTEEKLVIVFDLSGFTMACMDYEVVKMLVNILQYNYPEVLQSALVVNAPFIFSACWMIIRPWLDPVTAGKVTFCSKDELGKYIDPSQMPPDMLDPTKFDDDEAESEEDADAKGGVSRADGGGKGVADGAEAKDSFVRTDDKTASDAKSSGGAKDTGGTSDEK